MKAEFTPETKRQWLIPTAAGSLGILYLTSLAPTVHVHDAGELTAAAWTLGLAHPPGAPLYMLLCKVFMTLVPYGHIAWRANLLSALFAVALFLLLTLWAGKRGIGPLGSIAVGGIAALSPTLWSQALMAEVYTLEALLLAAVLISLDLESRPEITALLWGLLLSCHIGPAPLTPIVLFLLVWPARGWKNRLRLLVRVTIACCLPLLLYAYIPIRASADPAINWGRPKSLQEFWWYLSNANVRARSFSLSPTAYFTRALEYGTILLRNVHFALLVAIVGLFRSPRYRMKILASAVILSDAAFVVLLDSAPLESEAYGIPAILALAFLTGLGLETMARRIPTQKAAIALVLGTLILVSWRTHDSCDYSRSFVVRDTVESILDQVPRGSVLFTQEDNTTFPLAYLTAVEGARPDLEIYDRAGNLFRSPYDRPLHRVTKNLPAFRQQQEEALMSRFLSRGTAIVSTSSFLEYEPVGWHLQSCGTVAFVTESPAQMPEHCVLPPRPRSPLEPDWMSRQILAMDSVKRAVSHISLGNMRRALVELASAWDLAGIAELQLRIALLSFDAGAPELAESAASRAVDIKAELAPAWVVFGMAAYRQKHLTEAENRFSQALGLAPGDPQVLIDRALVRKARGHFTEALADVEEACRMQPEGRAPILRIFLLARSGARKPVLVEALCNLSRSRDAASLEVDELREILLISARAGAPDCISLWLGNSNAQDSARAAIINAYLETLGGSE